MVPIPSQAADKSRFQKGLFVRWPTGTPAPSLRLYFSGKVVAVSAGGQQLKGAKHEISRCPSQAVALPGASGEVLALRSESRMSCGTP